MRVHLFLCFSCSFKAFIVEAIPFIYTRQLIIMSTSQTQVETFEISAQESFKLMSKSPQPCSELSIKTENNSTSSSEATKSYPSTTSPFPLQNLPSEIRHEIYAHYFASLPPHHISCSAIANYRQQQRERQKAKDLGTEASNTSSSSLPPFHTLSPLLLSSPFFTIDIPTFIYYQQTKFSFSCPSALKSFSSSDLTQRFTRKIRIAYGGIGDQGPDWVYLILKAFERLEEVVFIVDEGCRCCG